MDEVVALVVPEGDHAGTVARCFKYALSRGASGPETDLAQWVLIESVNLCNDVDITESEIYGLRAAMRAPPPAAAVTMVGSRQRSFGRNGTTFRLEYPEEVKAWPGWSLLWCLIW